MTASDGNFLVPTGESLEEQKRLRLRKTRTPSAGTLSVIMGTTLAALKKRRGA
ncbi:hypothetical protein MMC07_003440 [Pseudocyphellaria aurata]|nr:hypothetical protein [Pseudocyphellaria aurata]